MSEGLLYFEIANFFSFDWIEVEPQQPFRVKVELWRDSIFHFTQRLTDVNEDLLKLGTTNSAILVSDIYYLKRVSAQFLTNFYSATIFQLKNRGLLASDSKSCCETQSN